MKRNLYKLICSDEIMFSLVWRDKWKAPNLAQNQKFC